MFGILKSDGNPGNKRISTDKQKLTTILEPKNKTLKLQYWLIIRLSKFLQTMFKKVISTIIYPRCDRSKCFFEKWK